MKPTSLTYRPDIDGLRAIAVLLVLVFHAGISALPGGFVGVDVFFVLTGYLITALLLREVDGGSLDLRRFYLRRFRRLLPALLTVVAATFVAGWFLLLPQDLVALTDSARFAVASIGNFWFHANTGGYFDVRVHELPLLHTWSLGVEEQYYLLWPGLVLLGSRTLSSRGRRWALWALFGVGLAFSQWSAVFTPAAAYYLLPARAFEILLGALVAAEIGRVPAEWKGKGAASVTGILLVMVPALVLDAESTFPGFNALWPCLGTALLIVTGQKTSPAWVNRVLSVRPLVALGLLSYSIYLWHWPLIAFVNYRGIPLEGAVTAGVLLAPIGLAAATYWVVERPFRHRFIYGFWPTLLGLVVVPLIVVFFAADIANRWRGFPERFGVQVTQLRRENVAAADGNCRYDRNLKRLSACRVGINVDRVDGLIVGDSYAGMYTQLLDVLATDASLSLRHRWWRLSPPIPDTSVGRRPSFEQRRYTRERAELLDDHEYAFLVSAWGNYRYPKGRKTRLWNADGDDVSERADDLQLEHITELVQKGVRVVLLDRPLAQPGPQLAKQYMAQIADGVGIRGVRAPITPPKPNGLIARVRAAHPEVLIIQPLDGLCDDATCAVEIDGLLLFRDDGSHLTHAGAHRLGQLWLERGENPLRRAAP